MVPKRLRQKVGLTPGVPIRAWEEDGRLVLEPVPEQTALVEEGGLLLCDGRLEGGIVTAEELREERIEELLRRATR